MNQLNLTRVAVSLQVKVPADAIEQHSAASPYVVGEELARQVAAYVQHERLGYYPALEYFRTIETIDPELLKAEESISWLVCGLVREELRTRLRAVFSNLKFESVQTVAYTMPGISLRIRSGSIWLRLPFVVTKIIRMPPLNWHATKYAAGSRIDSVPWKLPVCVICNRINSNYFKEVVIHA